MIFQPIPIGAWAGEVIGIAANGPSLRPMPRGRCDHWIAVNDAFRLFPFAEIVYGADHTWWREHAAAVRAAAPCASWLCGDPHGDLPAGVERIRLDMSENLVMPDDPAAPIVAGGFSGYQAAQIAWAMGGRRIELYGFDCKTIEQHARWFGGFNPLDAEKMARIGPVWEKKITELICELTRRGVAVDRILPARPIGRPDA